MESYQIVENVYRIPGGYGRNGEVFGGILINDNPTIVIGASGGTTFLNNLKEIITSLQLSHDFRLYLTSTTFQEVDTLEHVRKEFPEATFYIHRDIAPMLQQPRKDFMKDRYGDYNKDAASSMAKKLPKRLENIVEIDKRSSFQAEKTKILVIPFAGPHRGHTFIYSTAHKLLCSGLIGGYSSTEKRLYYLDFTGSIKDYKNSFSFLKQAEAKIVAPAYDEPQLIKGRGISTIEVENAIEKDIEAIFELCTLLPKELSKILAEFRRYHGFEISTFPYDRIKMDALLVEFHLKAFVEEGKVITKDGLYRRK